MHIQNLRQELICLINKNKNSFQEAEEIVTKFLNEGITKYGNTFLKKHLRTCGDIPEIFPHDSTEEKIYSKYSDVLLAITFTKLGLNAKVLSERGDSADVDVFDNINDFSFVADAKTFRLSRTAKNQKDFKVQAMNNWKKNKNHAIIICPQHQLPSKTSQIYFQSGQNGVGILTYNHLSYLIAIKEKKKELDIGNILKNYFLNIKVENPSKIANLYWQRINQNFKNHFYDIESWQSEKKIEIDELETKKKLAQTVYNDQIRYIKNLNKEDAIKLLLDSMKLESKIETINNVSLVNCM